MKVLPKALVSPNNRLILSAQKLKTFKFGNREQNKEPQNLKGNNWRWTL